MVKRVPRVFDSDYLYLELEKLICWAAHKFKSDKNVFMSLEDLIGEGNLVFSKLINSHSHLTHNQFKALFKVSLFNHFNTLLTKYKYNSNRGYEEGKGFLPEEDYIDLSEIAETIGINPILDIYFNEYVNQVKDILKFNPELIALFEQLINPSEGVYELVLEEAKRKSYVANKFNVMKMGVNKITVKKHHIQKYLGLSKGKFKYYMDIITKTVNEVLNLNYTKKSYSI